MLFLVQLIRCNFQVLRENVCMACIQHSCLIFQVCNPMLGCPSDLFHTLNMHLMHFMVRTKVFSIKSDVRQRLICMHITSKRNTLQCKGKHELGLPCLSFIWACILDIHKMPRYQITKARSLYKGHRGQCLKDVENGRDTTASNI